MAVGDGVEQEIELADFTLGILNTYRSKTSQPSTFNEEGNGIFATEEGTYGCYGHPAGGLHPLPGRAAPIKMLWRNDFYAKYTTSTQWYKTDTDMRILATNILSPYTAHDSTAFEFKDTHYDTWTGNPAWKGHDWRNHQPLGPGVTPVAPDTPDVLQVITAVRSGIGPGYRGDPTEESPIVNGWWPWFLIQMWDIHMYTSNTLTRIGARNDNSYHFATVFQTNDAPPQYVFNDIRNSAEINMKAHPWMAKGSSVIFRGGWWPAMLPFPPAHITRVTTGTLWDAVEEEYVGWNLRQLEGGWPGYEPGRVASIFAVDLPTNVTGFDYNVMGQNEGCHVVLHPRANWRRVGEQQGDAMENERSMLGLVYTSSSGAPGETMYGNEGNASYRGYLALNHQNRYVWCKRTYEYTSGDPKDMKRPAGFMGEYSVAQRMSGDLWRYVLNTNDLAGALDKSYMTSATAPAPEYNSTPVRWGGATEGFGAAASMNGSELFLVKQNGGGTIVRGNIATPQLTDYPSVPSTKGAANIPVVTPDGLVYGTRDGVVLWKGADQFTSLSPQLEGWFWKPSDGSTDDIDYNAAHGKFNYSHPFVFAPNGWVFDTRTNAWFRLEDPDDTDLPPYKFYEVSTTGDIYAIHGRYTNPTPNDGSTFIGQAYTVGHRYRPSIPTTHYSWQSQPLPVTAGRVVDFHQVRVVTQGKGTVAVTVKGLGGATGTVTFNVDSATPTVQYARIKVRCNDPNVRIVVTGDPSDPTRSTPIIHRLGLGYAQSASVPKTQ